MSCSNIQDIDMLTKLIQVKQQIRGKKSGTVGTPSNGCENIIEFFDNSGIVVDDVECCDTLDYSKVVEICDDCDDDCKCCCDCLRSLSGICKKCDNVKKCAVPCNIQCQTDCKSNVETIKRINNETSVDFYGRLNRIRSSINPGKKSVCGKSPDNQNKTDNVIRSVIPSVGHSGKCCPGLECPDVVEPC